MLGREAALRLAEQQAMSSIGEPLVTAVATLVCVSGWLMWEREREGDRGRYFLDQLSGAGLATVYMYTCVKLTHTHNFHAACLCGLV